MPVHLEGFSVGGYDCRKDRRLDEMSSLMDLDLSSRNHSDFRRYSLGVK